MSPPCRHASPRCLAAEEAAEAEAAEAAEEAAEAAAEEEAAEMEEERVEVEVGGLEGEARQGDVPDAVTPEELAVTVKAPAAKRALAKAAFSLSFSRKSRGKASVSK